MPDKKVQKTNPLLDPKNLIKISGWTPWEPSLDSSRTSVSEEAYLKFLGQEEKLIQQQESSIKDPEDLDQEDDLRFSLNKAREHLSKAAKEFANEVDFLKWVQRVVDEAAKEND
jgi:hypothetical protein